MRKIKLVFAVCSFIFFLGTVLLPNSELVYAEDGVIQFGVLPLQQPEEMFERFAPMIDYLEAETGLRFELRLYSTAGEAGGYNAAVKGIITGDTPFAYLASVTIAQARHNEPTVEPLVCAENNGSATYIGEMAVRKDSDIQKVEDLAGRRVIGSSSSSTSGNLMPSGYLMQIGMSKDQFAAMDFAGGHDKAAMAVLSGEYDCCWINDNNFMKFKDKGEGLRSIWNHPPVPEFPICVNTKFVSPELVAKVKEALLRMHEIDPDAIKAVNKKYEKWVPMKWDDYQAIKDTIDRVHGLGFYDLK